MTHLKKIIFESAEPENYFPSKEWINIEFKIFVLLVATVIKLIVYFLCFDSVIYLRTIDLFELFSQNHTKVSQGQTSWVERPRP